MTAASTPEPPRKCGGQNAAKGVSSAKIISTSGLRVHARRCNTPAPSASPQAISPTTTAAKVPPALTSETPPVPTASTAKLKSISAVASLTRPSPSSTVKIRLGTESRRAIAMGATASGGETTAPSTNATAHGQCSSQCVAAATAVAVNSTQPTASSMMARRFFLKPRQLMPTPDE